jgi:hypothetical protein
MGGAGGPANSEIGRVGRRIGEETLGRRKGGKKGEEDKKGAEMKGKK